MEPIGAEKIWRYLNDDDRVVKGCSYVGNPGLYISGLLNILYWADPIALSEVKLKMKMENTTDKLLYGDLFFREREGYGKTEYRLVKIFENSKMGRNLEKYFPELLSPLKEKPKYDTGSIDIKRLETDINYRSDIYIKYFQLDEQTVKDVDNLINQNCMVVTNLIYYGPHLPENEEPKEKKVRRTS